MRLISLHIENFGVLSNFDYSFLPGVNYICEDNGYGKSTMAAFLRVMFYGFEGETRKAKSDKERLRFLPWQGGIYGGNICFENGGRKYKLTRQFGKKKDEDVYALQDAERLLDVSVAELSSDSGLGGNIKALSDDSTDGCIGELLFDLDAESFKKSIYISQADCRAGALTGRIGVKIGNIGSGEGDLDQYDRADMSLKKKMDSITPKRATGEVYRLNEKNQALRHALEDKHRVENDLEQVLNEITEITNGIEKCRKDQEESRKLQQEAIAKRETALNLQNMKDLTNQLTEETQIAQSIQTAFPGGVASYEEMDKLVEEYNALQSLLGKQDGERLSEEQYSRFEQLNAKFAQKELTDAWFDELAMKNRRMLQLRNEESARQLSDSDAGKLAALREKFKSDQHPKNSIRNLIGISREIDTEELRYSQLETELLRAREEVDSSTFRAKPSKTLGTAGICLIAAGIILVLMFVLCKLGILPSVIQGQTLILLIGAVLGVTLGGVLLLVHSSKKKEYHSEYLKYQEDSKKKKDKLDNLEQQLELLSEGIKSKKDRIQSALNGYGEDTNLNYVNETLTALMEQAYTYEQLLEKERQMKELRSGEDSKMLSEELSKVLSEYGFYASEDSYGEVIGQLKTQKQQWEALCENIASEKATRNRIQEAKQRILAMLDRFGLPRELAEDERQLRTLPMKAREYAQHVAVITDIKEKLEKILKDYPLLETMDAAEFENIPDANELEEGFRLLCDAETELKNRLDIFEAQRKELDERIVQLQESEQQSKELEQEIEEKTEIFRKLDMTRSYLAKAKENLISRYTDPLMKSFKKYYEMVTGISGDGIHIDAQANVRIHEKGMDREEYYFSEGNRDLIGFCMRLAYADAMYPRVKPFLVMDDPFVNLDDKRSAGALDMLKQIGNEYQVIFYTCHGINS